MGSATPLVADYFALRDISHTIAGLFYPIFVPAT